MIRLVNKELEVDMIGRPVKYFPRRSMLHVWVVNGVVRDKHGALHSERWLFFEKENATRFYNQYK